MSERLQDLIERHLNDELNDDEKRELAEQLDSNSDARKMLVEHAEFNSAVTTVLKSDSGKGAAPLDFTVPSRKISIVPWLIAAAACLLLVIKSLPDKKTIETVKAPEDKPLTALLVNEAGAEFANGRSIDDVKFSPGEYILTEGAVHLRFSSGADLVVEAPAQLKILDDMNTLVATRDVNYEDIGTEFGLKVDDSGASELHVFDGQVNVKDPKTDKLLKKVFKGQAVAYEKGQKATDRKLNSTEFLTASRIGFHRWKNQISKLAADPDVIACYPFVSSENSILKNTVTATKVTDGTISGARWVSGRWPGKEALLFDRKDDFVELDIPLELDEVSVSMWLKIDRHDTKLSPLFNSNKWDEGDIHLQLMRTRQPHFDVFGSTVGPKQKKLLESPVSHSKWIHIVLVLSSRESRGDIYINGQHAVDGKFPVDAVIRPGKCRIGNWVPIPGYEPERRFNGRIDELVIWKKVLAEKEIQQLVENGRPSVLWSVGEK
jgi:hypothetical protein